MKKTVAFGLPAVAGASAGGAALLGTKGWMLFLWPSLVALAFLLGCAGAVLLGRLRWLWPLGAGFVTQTVGVILLATNVFRSPLDPLWWTLGVVVGVLLAMLIAWITLTVRARWLESQMMHLPGGAGGDDLGKIRENMADALEKLRHAGGRGAIYELPWFLVIGRSGVGKTVAIKNSGIGLPSRKDWVKGVGGTVTLNFFFTNDLIFLDTPGKWVQDGADAQEQQQWVEVLRLLRKYRGRRPLDGIVATVSADDLLSLSDEGLRDQAARVREVIDLLYAETCFRFPIYLLVTKCDLVDGFVDFFRNLPVQRRNEVLGCSFEDSEEIVPEKEVARAFGRMLRRLETFRLEALARLVGGRARRLYFFVEEFRRVERPLTVFASELFGSDRYHDAPIFRGFYFTSGTQGEGMPLGQAMAELVRGLGVKASKASPAEGEAEPSRSYFLKDLFRTVMVGDDGLVGRTVVHWWRQRRNTFFGAFLPATLALVVLAMSGLSFGLNRAAFRESVRAVQRVLDGLAGTPARPDGESIAAALEQTGRLLDAHERIANWSLWRTWGMRQHEPLSVHTFRAFRTQFQEKALDPTLAEADRLIGEESAAGCATKMRVLRAVVYLRSGYRREWGGQLSGFEDVWKLRDARSEREELRRQFESLLEGADAVERQRLLAGFELKRAAERIAGTCGLQSESSALAGFASFQRDCQGVTVAQDIEQCYRRLSDVLIFKPGDYEEMRKEFEGLKGDLEDLHETDQLEDAGQALLSLKTVAFGDPDRDTCASEFETKVSPAIQALAWQDEGLIKTCQTLSSAGGKGYALFAEALKTREPDLGKLQAKLQEVADSFGAKCGRSAKLDSMDVGVVRSVAQGYWRITCVGREPPPSVAVPAAARAPRGVASPAPREDRVASSSLKWLVQPRVHAAYRQPAWQDKRRAWENQLRAAGEVGLTEAQKSAERQAVREQVHAFATSYARFWKDYLRGVSVRAKPEDMPLSAWLEELSRTTEYDRVLGEAKAALAIQEQEDPFREMELGLGDLTRLRSDLDVSLSRYRQYLAEVAAKMRECEADPKRRQQYGNSIESQNLGEALRWVAGNAGPERVLDGLFRAPLDEAKASFVGVDVLGRVWGDLVAAHGKLEGSLLFEGQDGSMLLPDETALANLLGGESGLVVQARQAASTGATLSADANAWLVRAARLSELLYAKGSNDLRPILLNVDVDSFVIEPKKLDASLAEIKVYFGTGSEFSWKEGDAQGGSLGVFLFGEKAYTRSSLRATIKLEKSKAMGLGKKFVDLPLRLEETGNAAPLKLLARGREAGLDGLESGEVLQFSFSVEEDKKPRGKLTLNLRIEGENLGRLLDFLRNGLAAPPATPK